MSDTDAQVPLPDLNSADAPPLGDVAYHEDEQVSRVAADLEAATAWTGRHPPLWAGGLTG